MSTTRSHRRVGACQGFTLLEVLMVVAVIGILVAIIIPALGGAQTSAKRAKTRVQFSQWSAAIEQFRQEYGYYPVFTGNLVNGGSPSGDLGTQHIFHDTLAGVRRDGSAITSSGSSPAPEAQNPKRIRFCPFAGDDMSNAGLIQDAFGNTDIGVLVDRNVDSSIDLAGVTDYATAPGPSLTIGSVSVPTPTTNRIRAGVAFYSAGDGQTAVTSW